MPFLPKIAISMLTVLLMAVVVICLSAMLYDKTGQHSKDISTTNYLLQKNVKLIIELIDQQYNKTRGTYRSVVPTRQFLLQFW